MASEHKRKHRKSSQKSNEISMRSVESLFSKHLLRIAGVIFLGIALWFAANSAGPLLSLFQELRNPVALTTAPQPAAPQTEENQTNITATDITPTSPLAGAPRMSGWLFLFLGLILAGWIGLQLLTKWRRQSAYQEISVFLVFLALLLLIRRYSWNIEWVFSLLLVITAGLFFFGRHISHNGTRLNFVFAWGLLLMWWGIQVLIKSRPDALTAFFVFATLFFIAFHVIQLFHGFSGGKKWYRWFEPGSVFLNFLIYYGMMVVTLVKLHNPLSLFWVTGALGLWYFGTMWFIGSRHHPIPKFPFIYILILLGSLLLPLLFRFNQFILFTGSLSVLLLFYTRESKNQYPVLVSLGLTILMVLWYLKGVLLSYLPAALVGGLAHNLPLFYHGLVAGILVTGVLWINRWMLHNVQIKLSRKWFSKRRYRRILKVMFLGSLYIVAFWIFQFLFIGWNPSPQGSFLSWFFFNLIFFLIAIPWLAYQHSSSNQHKKSESFLTL